MTDDEKIDKLIEIFEASGLFDTAVILRELTLIDYDPSTEITVGQARECTP